MKLLVQSYLETHSLDQLREERGVKHRWSTKRPGVLTLNYDQLAVCDTDPLSQECRGLVLRATAPHVARLTGSWENGSWPDAFLDVLLGMDERAERAREAA